MYVICTDNGGFEDQLTDGSVYMVETIGENDYAIYNNTEELRSYGTAKFTIIEQPKE